MTLLPGLFRHTTNSYKYLFFLALIDTQEDGSFCEWIDVEDLVLRGLRHAWYPHFYFRLRFGKQDHVPRVLEPIAAQLEADELKRSPSSGRLLDVLGRLKGSEKLGQLCRFVPRALLTPFASEAVSLPSSSRDYDKRLRRISDWSREAFDTGRTPYQLREDDSAVLVNPEWAVFLHENRKVLRAWVRWEWLEFLRSRNLDVPELAQKLIAPEGRRSLGALRTAWSAAAKERAGVMRCFYGGQGLGAGNFALDHFIPWSFLLHDQAWNLVPCHRQVNSSKCDRIPVDWPQLVPRMAAHHAELLIHSRTHLESDAWERLVSEYVAGLRFDDSMLRTEHPDPIAIEGALFQRYEEVFPQLVKRAGSLGFQASWKYTQT